MTTDQSLMNADTLLALASAILFLALGCAAVLAACVLWDVIVAGPAAIRQARATQGQDNG